MENYKDALESSTEVSITRDSGEHSTRDLVGIQCGSGKDSIGISWGSRNVLEGILIRIY